MRIALCFLTYNERECLEKMMPRLDTSVFDDVFAVDAGSTDGTLGVYHRYGIRVVLQKSRGRGEAFKLAEQSTDADAVVYFSPDGNEDPKDFPKFRPYLENGADIVIASRMIQGAFNEEDASRWRPRKWINKFLNLIANLFWNRSGRFISDSINGYRAIRRGLIAWLKQDAGGYTIEYQNTIRAMKNGLKIVEFPTHEGQRLAGRTKAPSFRVGLEFIGCLFKEIWLSWDWMSKIFGKKFLIVVISGAILTGLVYILPPILIENHITDNGGSFLLVQPETYRDEFFSYLPRDREVFDGHLPASGPYANDTARTLMNPLPPLIFSLFLKLARGNVTAAYLAAQFVFSAIAFMLFYFLGLRMSNSKLWAGFFGFLGVFTHLAEGIFYYTERDALSLFVKDFLPFVRTPIPKLHLARIDDPLLTMPILLAAFLVFYSFWKKPKISNAVITAILTGLLSYTYLHHWLIMMMIIGVGFLLTLFFYRQDKERVKNYLFIFVILAIVLIPYLVNNFSFLATYGKDFALRLGLQEGRGLAWDIITSDSIMPHHIIYGIVLVAVYLVYFKVLRDKNKGFFMMACVLSMFLVWQIPIVLGSFPQISHFIKSVSLVMLILVFNLVHDVCKIEPYRRKAAAFVVALLMIGMIGKKAVNTLKFIVPPADIVEMYSFPKELLDSWDWIDANLGHEPTIISSSLVTSLYLAGNTSARPFLPTGFISALSTAELERRFLLANKLFGVSPEILKRRFADFEDNFEDRCFSKPCFKASHFNFTKNRWYLTEHGWYMTRMAQEPDKVIDEYNLAQASWKDAGVDYVYYGPWEKQFSSINLSEDLNLNLIYKNSLTEIYAID